MRCKGFTNVTLERKSHERTEDSVWMDPACDCLDGGLLVVTGGARREPDRE
jgi:hypothetical protein